MKKHDKKEKPERSRSREKSPVAQYAKDDEAKKREERRKKFGTTIGNTSQE
jgi:hypothetical protein